MLNLRYSDVWQSIQHVMDDEKADPAVVDDLIFLFNKFDSQYDYRTIKVAMDTPTEDTFSE